MFGFSPAMPRFQNGWRYDVQLLHWERGRARLRFDDCQLDSSPTIAWIRDSGRHRFIDVM